MGVWECETAYCQLSTTSVIRHRSSIIEKENETIYRISDAVFLSPLKCAGEKFRGDKE
jgi:hypothetical protein